jgi:glucose uptake protein
LGTFSPLVEKGQASEVGLGPYAICVVFAVGVFLSAIPFSLFLMNLPVEGEPVELVDYFKSRPSQHLLGILGGAIWCVGAAAAFVSASGNADMSVGAAGVAIRAPVGPAVSYALGQGAALIGALWGILLWKEFKGADPKVQSLTALMFVLFAAGLALVSMAPLYAVGQ